MSRLDTHLERYKCATPTKNLACLEVQVQARLSNTVRSQGFIAFLSEGFSQMPTRFAALALALVMGMGFGMMPSHSAVAQNEFRIFSGDAPYLPSTLLSRHE
jgi:hypothetical protein